MWAPNNKIFQTVQKKFRQKCLVQKSKIDSDEIRLLVYQGKPIPTALYS